ncbi:MAG: hypothetical protein ACE5Q6_24015 [Dehalococcoidia bacterium]
MNRVRVSSCVALSGIFVIFVACFQEVDRSFGGTPPALTPVPSPSLPPVPVQSPIIVPTAEPTPTPTRVPVPTTMPTLLPTKAAPPAPTSAPPATPTLTPLPTATPPPIPPLLLQVEAPEDGSQTPTNQVLVQGVTNPDAKVTVNGEPASLERDGRFQGTVALLPGLNEIEVVATDSHGNRKTRKLTINSLAQPPQPFMLLITEPRDQSIIFNSIIRLSGRTGPEALVSVNGVTLPVDTLGIFSTKVSLEPGPNIIDVVSTNIDGQVMTAVVAVIFRP